MKVSGIELLYGKILTISIQWNEWKIPVRRILILSWELDMIIVMTSLLYIFQKRSSIVFTLPLDKRGALLLSW